MARQREHLEWSAAGDEAREAGQSEAQVMSRRLAELQDERRRLHEVITQRDEVLKVAAGHQRAASKRLAQVQAQVAAVAGLRERYEELQVLLANLEGADAESETIRTQLHDSQTALDSLRTESGALQDELAAARHQLRHIDPIETETGRRWVMLMAALLMVLAVVVTTLVMALRAANDQVASINEVSLSVASTDPSTNS